MMTSENTYECRMISMGLAYDKWFLWLMKAEQNVCDHPSEHWKDESWFGPESGGFAGQCRICGWGVREIFY